MAGGIAGRILRDEIDRLVEEGASLDEIERTVIETAGVNEDLSAALWLYAWGRTEREHQRALVVV